MEKRGKGRIRKTAGMLLKRAAEIVFPEGIYCLACGAVIDRARPYSLCDSCLSHFHFAVGKTCVKCGKLLEEGYRHEQCRDCRDHERVFDRGYSCMLYGLYEKEMIRAFKYKGRSYYARPLAELMYDRVEPLLGEEIRADLVCPVPMYHRKVLRRGYNQAELLARGVAERMDLPMRKLLCRTRKTVPMSRLSGAERRENLKDAIAMAPGAARLAAGKNILLIDDIFTSGSTADTCAKILKQAGCGTVTVLCLAAGGNYGGEADSTGRYEES